jgi:putative ABC transport system substrate-binding protein
MQRRNFIRLLGGAAVAWPLAARAQQAERVRRIGMLTGVAGEDAHTKVGTFAFVQELQRLGWIDGRNVRIDIRWATVNVAGIRKHAAEFGGQTLVCN